MVGNVMIDSLRHFLPIAQQSGIGDELGLKNGAGWHGFGVLTLHRPSNVDSTEKLSQLLGAIDAVAADYRQRIEAHWIAPFVGEDQPTSKDDEAA